MKKAVITTGGKQYLVKEGETLEVETLSDAKNKLELSALLILDGDKVQVGAPEVAGAKISAEIVDNVRDDKVTSIRFKAKKRVNKKRGHRQTKSVLKINKITTVSK